MIADTNIILRDFFKLVILYSDEVRPMIELGREPKPHCWKHADSMGPSASANGNVSRNTLMPTILLEQNANEERYNKGDRSTRKKRDNEKRIEIAEMEVSQYLEKRRG
ncbi:MAG: hypothetical protein HZA28_01385 [Candidatus Omnitrophica bacterium]|nr:hypothetical protein [Candidatus Omnitrophota bacterium]